MRPWPLRRRGGSQVSVLRVWLGDVVVVVVVVVVVGDCPGSFWPFRFWFVVRETRLHYDDVGEIITLFFRRWCYVGHPPTRSFSCDMFVFDVHRFRAKRSSVLEKASEEHRLCWKQVFGFVWWAGARGFCLGTLGRAPPLPCVRTSECNVRVWVENKRRRAKAGVKRDQVVFAAPAFLPAGAAGLTREYIHPEMSLN